MIQKDTRDRRKLSPWRDGLGLLIPNNVIKHGEARNTGNGFHSFGE